MIGEIFFGLFQNILKKGKFLSFLMKYPGWEEKILPFLGKLKTAWDMYFSKNPNLIMALCGSISSWIEENILSSTGFVGRITIDLVLEELPLNVCNAFWHPKEKRIAAYEKFKLLSVTGGVPRYLEEINPKSSCRKKYPESLFYSRWIISTRI